MQFFICILLSYVCFFSSIASLIECAEAKEDLLALPFVCASVNVITGSYVEVQTDLKQVEGAPFSLRRTYENPGSSDEPLLLGWRWNVPGMLLSSDHAEQDAVDDQNRLLRKNYFDPVTGELRGSLDFTYQEKEGRYSCLVSAEDGREVNYHYRIDSSGRSGPSALLERAEGSDLISVQYSYREHPVSNRFLLTHRQEPNYRFLETEYYDSTVNDVGGTVVILDDPLRDFRLGRVKLQRAPVSTDATPIITHRFFYQEGATTVIDAQGGKTIYRYSKEGNLEAIEQYLKEDNGTDSLYRIERFRFEGRHLVAKWLEDSSQTVHLYRSFSYNAKGQLIKDTLFGNLSGACKAVLQTGKQEPIDNGIERYSVSYTYSKDEASLLLSTTQDNGYCTEYDDESGTKRLAAKQGFVNDQIDQRTFNRYDSNGNVIEQTEILPSGKTVVTAYQYDFSNRLVSQEKVDSEGKNETVHHRYDLLGNRVATIDTLGHETSYVYDSLGRMVEIVSPEVLNQEGQLIRPCKKICYDISNCATSIIDPNGYETKISYNARGQPTHFLHPDGTEESVLYRLDGSEASKTAKDGTKTVYERDSAGRPTAVNIYDAHGTLINGSKAFYRGSHLIGYTDAEGMQYQFEYDEKGCLVRLKQEGKGEARFTEFTYEGTDSIARKTACGGDGSMAEVSAAPPPDPLFQGAEPLISTRYNHLGQLVKEAVIVDKKGVKSTALYDTLGRVVEMNKINSLGTLLSRVTLRYDAAGNKVKEIHEKIIQGQCEGLYLIGQIFGPGNRLEELIEDAEGEAKSTRYGYDFAGRVAYVQKPCGVFLYFSYGAAGRVHDLFSSDHSVHYSYRYDAFGNLVRIEDKVHNQLISRTYDGFQQLINETQSNGLDIAYRYDPLGRKVETRLFDGSLVGYVYEGNNLKAVERFLPDGTLCYRHIYTSFNAEGSWESASLIYNLGELRKQQKGERGFSIESPYFKEVVNDEGVDEASNITQLVIEDAVGKVDKRFLYDELNQLVQESGFLEKTHRFDSLGNCQDFSPKVKHTIIYDALDRPVEWVKDEEEKIRYAYDCFDRCFERAVFSWDSASLSWKEATKSYFYYDGLCEIGEVSSDNRWIALRILGQGLGAEIGAAVAVELQGEIFAPLHDHVGNLTSLVSAKTGAVEECYRYSAFGEQRIYEGGGEELGASAFNNPWGFSSKRTDEKTGWVLFGRRWYLPASGAWTTADPLGFVDGPNRFQFAQNNPLTHIDLFGEYSLGAAWNDFWGFVDQAYAAIESVRSRVSLFNYLKDDMHETAELVAGNIFLRLAGYYTHPPETGVYGHGEVDGKLRVTMTNGILNIRSDFFASMEMLSSAHGGVNIHYVFRPSEGWTRDLVLSGLAKLGFSSTQTKQLVQVWRQMIEEMGGVESGGEILHYAHSLGATETYNARRYLSSDEKKMIRVVTFGSPTLIPDDIFASVINYVSKRDCVPYLDPVGYFRGLLSGDRHVIYAGSSFGIPFIDHMIDGSTYKELIEMLGEEFKILYGTLIN